MNANELRVNQTYILPDGYHRLPSGVTTLSGGDLSVILDYGLEEEITPIPITEEPLLKCGFEKNGLTMSGTEWYEYKRPFIGWGDYRITKRGDSEWAFTLECVIPPTNAVSTISYLHQLQNLVFALTGEELTFKQEI